MTANAIGLWIDLRSPDFLPGGAKYGDLPGMLAAGEPGTLWLAGEEDDNALLKSRHTNPDSRLTLVNKSGADVAAAAVEFLNATRQN